jgi:hypothetical protein
MKTWLVVLAASCATLNCVAQTGNLPDWQKLMKNNDADGARKLCTPFEDSKMVAEQVEAEKCLANVELWGGNPCIVDNFPVSRYFDTREQGLTRRHSQQTRGRKLASLHQRIG